MVDFVQFDAKTTDLCVYIEWTLYACMHAYMDEMAYVENG